MRFLIWIFTCTVVCRNGATSGETCNDTINFALNRPTNQSTTYKDGIGGDSGRAVDGNRNPAYLSGSCSHTDTEKITIPWWQVDLQMERTITKVLITNRDSLEFRLRNLRIEAGQENTEDQKGPLYNTTLCVHWKDNDVGKSETREFSCIQFVKGRFLRISIDPNDLGVGLTMCEVEVYGCEITETTTGYDTGTTTTTTTSLTTTTTPTTSPVQPQQTTTTSLTTTTTPTTSSVPPQQTTTTTAFTTTSSPTGCTCSCSVNANLSIEQMAEIVTALKRELTVNKKQTNSYIRKVTSATDRRSSSKFIGGIGSALLVSLFGLIVACDIPRFIKFIQHICPHN